VAIDLRQQVSDAGIEDKKHIPENMKCLFLRTLILCPLALVSGCVSSHNLVEGELHLLPAGYKGSVTIVFNQPHAPLVSSTNGMRIYAPDSAGFFYTRSPQLKGYFPCHLLRYAYINSSDTTNIAELALTEDSLVRMDRIYIYDRSFSKDTIRYYVGPPLYGYNRKAHVK
jgi:hypothetical protein